MGYVGEVARLVQDSGSAVGSVTIPFTAAVPVGQTLIMAVDTSGGSTGVTISATDTAGNTWTSRGLQDASVSNYRVAILSCVVTTALTTSDSVTASVSSGVRATWLAMVEAFDDLAAFDVAVINSGSATSAIDFGTTAAGAQDSELVFGAVGWSGSPTFSSAAAGYTAATPAVASTALRSMQCQWGYVSAPGTRATTATLSGGSAWGTVLGVFTTAAPSASFTATVSGLTVAVDGTASTAQGSATITSYDWDWGDGTTHGTGSTAGHTYATAGTYTITLTVTDSNGLTDAAPHPVTAVGAASTGSYASISTATGCTPSTGSGTAGVLTCLTDGDRSTYVGMANSAHLVGAAVALVPPVSGQPTLAVFSAQAASAFDGTTPNVAASAVLTVKMMEGATTRGTTTVNVQIPAVGPATPPDPADVPGSVVAALFPWTGAGENVTDWNNVTFDVTAALS